MPHYKNGTEANVGDIVKGQGYNIKHEIVGIVTEVVPQKESCNIIIACNFRPLNGLDKDLFRNDAARGMKRNLLVVDDTINQSSYSDSLLVYGTFGRWFDFDIEYGQADNFTKVI